METLLLIEREGPSATPADRVVRAFRGYRETYGDERPLSLIRRAAWMAELRDAMAKYGHVACVDGVGLMQQGSGECPEVIITVPSVCYQKIPIANRVNDLGLKRPAKTWRFTE
jgi:hypothetical protein